MIIIIMKHANIIYFVSRFFYTIIVDFIVVRELDI